MNNIEHRFQVKLVKWFRDQGFVCWSSLNGANISDIERFNQIRAGLWAGVADVEFMLDSGRCAYMELKTEDGVQSKSQKLFEAMCKRKGHHYFLVRPGADFKKIVDKLKEIESK